MLIDTEAPIDVLHDTAAYRLRSVTQLVETRSLGKGVGHDALLLQDFAQVLAIPLRFDGCGGAAADAGFSAVTKMGDLKGSPVFC